MLAERDGSAPPPARSGLDPVAGLSALLLGILALGLFAAAVLATYGYYVPPVETPMVAALSSLFGLVLALNLIAAMVRRVRAG